MAAAKGSPVSRTDVIGEIAAETQLPGTKVDQVLKAFEGSLRRTLASGGEVRINGFGSFSVSERAARTGRNPATGESIKIKASKNVRFKAAKAMKDALDAKKGKAAAAKAAPAKAAPAKAAAGAKGAAKAAPAKAAPAKAAAKAPASKAAPAKAAPSKAAAAKGGAKGGKKK
jgi:DNA-binding protein HU-beta